MSKKEERAGAAYAAEQIESDNFQMWIREQMIEASRMDPDDLLPLETKKDAREIARNMLKQLEWDVKRDLNESREFFKGFSEYLKRKEVVDRLAEEILVIWGEITAQGRDDDGRHSWEPEARAARKRRAPEMSGGAFEFAELLRSLVEPGRHLTVRSESRLGGPAHYYETTFVNFVNLPSDMPAGGAQGENNRMMFTVNGFDGADPHASPPSGKVKVEMKLSMLPREYRLRAKTAPPGVIAQYLADFLNRVIAEVPPNYTHSQPLRAAREGRTREGARIVADFNTLNDLIRHAADELGATHVYGEGAHTKIYFPRSGRYTYEEAGVWRKAGYWHAEGPHARVGVSNLPLQAKPIAGSGRRRVAAEASRRTADPLKPRRGAFDIATRGEGRETVKGYVAGDYGMRKVKWFWEFTHLPTGVLLTTYPPHEKLDSALEHLEDLARHGPPEHHANLLQRGTWGLQESGCAAKLPSGRQYLPPSRQAHVRHRSLGDAHLPLTWRRLRTAVRGP